MVVVCPKCKSTFRDDGKLRRHLNAKRACNVESVKHCAECDKRFPSVTHYKRHAEAVHKLRFSDVEATIIVPDSQGVKAWPSINNVTINANNVSFNIPSSPSSPGVSLMQTNIASDEDEEYQEVAESEESETAFIEAEEEVFSSEEESCSLQHDIDEVVTLPEDTLASRLSRITTLQPVVNVQAYLTLTASFIYLLRTREYIALQQPIYKIGKTEQLPGQRMAGYPKDSEIIVLSHSTDCKRDEGQLKRLLGKKFRLRRDIGCEYFEGDASRMKRCVHQYFANQSIQ